MNKLPHHRAAHSLTRTRRHFVHLTAPFLTSHTPTVSKDGRRQHRRSSTPCKQRAFHPVNPRTQHRTFRRNGGLLRDAQQEERRPRTLSSTVSQQLNSLPWPLAPRRSHGNQSQPPHSPWEFRRADARRPWLTSRFTTAFTLTASLPGSDQHPAD